jgi:hypothetical protein
MSSVTLLVNSHKKKIKKKETEKNTLHVLYFGRWREDNAKVELCLLSYHCKYQNILVLNPIQLQHSS